MIVSPGAAAPRRIVIPYRPRRWAAKLHAMRQRFAAIVLHRRAGKTTAVLNHHQRAACSDEWERERIRALVPNIAPEHLETLIHPAGGRHYAHIFPTRVQGKAAAWDKLKHYAAPVPHKVNESELMIRYANGNKVQIFGADDPDALRGPMFSGVSFDEFSQQPENVFSEVISKNLADSLGYAIFLGTLKGKDHLYRTWRAAERNPDEWFSLWQDIDTSLDTEENATIVALRQAMADDRKLVAQGVMTQAEFDQEWFLSTDASIKGAFYEKELTQARAEKRIGVVPVDPSVPVVTAWDLGFFDAMAVWFLQPLRTGEIRVVDYYENSGETIGHYVGVLNSKGYTYGKHYAPHDIEVVELSSGKSRLKVAAELGLRFETVQRGEVHEGIHAVRLILPRCWFDERRTEVGLNALRHYRKRFNKSINEFTATPVHDAFSHGADAFRTFATGYTGPALAQRRSTRHVGGSGSSTGTGWMR